MVGETDAVPSAVSRGVAGGTIGSAPLCRERTMHETIAEPGLRVPIKTWLPPAEIEPGAMSQLKAAASHPDVGPHVAVMPDCHVGFGVTIGCVFPTLGAVVPTAVGVDIACFTGDTLVPTLDGESYSLRTLFERGEPVYVWACTPSGKVVAAQATVLQTRKDAPLVEVTLDDGATVRCTPDHRFMLRDGSYAEAADLSPDASLMPLYARRDDEGYVRIQQNHSGYWQRAHWIVARSGLLGDIPSIPGQRTVIHHVDFDEANNLPGNLVFMGNGDHAILHRGIVERNTYWQSESFEQKRLAALSAKARTDEGHAEYAARAYRNLVPYWRLRPGEMSRVAIAYGNGQRGKTYLTQYNTSENGRAKSMELANRIYTCEACGEQVRSPVNFFVNHPKRCPARARSFSNHKVASIRALGQREDVFCLNVPGYHNFAIAAGVFVHNCGMCAVNTGREYRPKRMDGRFWGRWAERVRDVVPTGFGAHQRPQRWEGFEIRLKATELQPLLRQKAPGQLGTLGGGNHFLEAQVDEANRIWLMVHSGSRHTGLRIADHYTNQARALTAKRGLSVPPELWSLPLSEPVGQAYLHDMAWATEFALESRYRMLEALLYALGVEPDEVGGRAAFLNIHHNFARLEEHDGLPLVVHRKGATSARAGELGIIPGSMGAPSFIVRGKGNPDSFHSCSHGAGRRMGRNQARRTIDEAAFRQALAGTHTRPAKGYLDEAPQAYKDVGQVIARQTDLVEVVHTLRPVMTVKGDSRAKED